LAAVAGGGGVDQSATTPAEEGILLAVRRSAGETYEWPYALGGSDIGNLGGALEELAPIRTDRALAGGGGGGGSGLGGGYLVDSSLNFTVHSIPGFQLTFNTPNNTTQAGTHGTAAVVEQMAPMDRRLETDFLAHGSFAHLHSENAG